MQGPDPYLRQACHFVGIGNALCSEYVRLYEEPEHGEIIMDYSNGLSMHMFKCVSIQKPNHAENSP